MGVTNANYFSFNVNSSLLLVGQTGSGKSFLVHKLIGALKAAQSPEDLKLALFDPKRVEFVFEGKEYLLFNVVEDSVLGLDRLDELAILALERSTKDKPKPLIFVYIEECDMTMVDAKRFDEAVITINKNASRANMKLIFSTSRPTPDVLSKKLLASFELILAGSLQGVDYQYLGITVPSTLDRYSFVVKEQSHVESH